MGKSGLPIGNLFVTLSADASLLIGSMAQAQKSVSSTVQAIKKDLSELDRAVAQTMANVTKSVNKMTSALSAANAALAALSGNKAAGGGATQGSASAAAAAANMGLIVRQSGDLATTAAMSGLAVANLATQMTRMSSSTFGANERLIGYTKALTSTRATTRGAGADFIDVESWIVRSGLAYKNLGQIGAGVAQTLVTNTANIGGAVSKLPPILAATTASVGALAGGLGILADVMVLFVNEALWPSAVAYARFEHAMTNSLSIMGNVSDGMRKQMELTAREMGKNSTFTATELAAGYEYLATAGFDAAQSIKALSVVNDFAIAGQINLEKATFTLSRSLHALGQSTDDPTTNMMRMRRISDLLVRANALSTASIQGLAEALENRAAGAFRMYGVNVEEGIAMLTAFAKKGDEGARGGEHAYMVLRDVQKAFQENEQAWKDSKMSVYSNGVFRGPIAIIEEFEKALAGLDDEQQKFFIKQHGFQDRSIAAIQTILGSSDLMKKVKADLEAMTGATQEVAQKRLSSFINQFRMLWHSLKDVLLTIGEAFLPAMKLLVSSFKSVSEFLSEMESKYGAVTFVMTLFTNTVTMIITVIRSLVTVLSANKELFLGVWAPFAAGLSAFAALVAESIPLATDLFRQMFEMVVKLIPAIGDLIGAVGRFFTALKEISEGNTIRGGWELRGAKADATKAMDEIKSIVVSGASGMGKSISTHTTAAMKGAWKEMTDGFQESVTQFAKFEGKWQGALTDTWKEVKKQFGVVSQEVGKTGAAATAEAAKNASAIVDIHAGMAGKVIDEQRKRESEMFVNSYKFREELDKLNVPKVDQFKSGFSDIEDRAQAEIEIAQNTLKKIDELSKKGVELYEQDERRKMQAVKYYTDRIQQLRSDQVSDKMNKAGIEQLNKFQSPYLGMVSPELDKSLQNQKEIEDAKNKLDTLKNLGDQEITLVNNVQMRKAQALEYYNKRTKLLQQEQNKLVLASASNMFGSLADITAAFAGKQSGAYKAMFAVSKAFAIAEAIIKIQQGIASAASLGWPLGIVAMAQVAASTASIVSNIQAVKLEFAGEREKGGPVMSGKAYLVGEKGPEPFIPSSNGTILPNDFLQRGSNVSVVVNNYTDANATVNKRRQGDQDVYEVVVRRVKDEIANEIRDGRGGVAKSMEGSYKIRRG